MSKPLTPSHAYEIEIKSLLGSSLHAESLREKIRGIDATLVPKATKQRNHYFEGGTLTALREKIADTLSDEEKTKIDDIIRSAKSFSVRTADRDGKILLFVKATIDDTTSANGTARIEFEKQFSSSLEALDALVQEAGFTYQAKWSREREEYQLGKTTIAIDKNAGYGYLAEFERVVDDPGMADAVKQELRTFMQELGVEELAQDRLERMFAYYNQHWPEYYGTDKVFTIE